MICDESKIFINVFPIVNNMDGGDFYKYFPRKLNQTDVWGLFFCIILVVFRSIINLGSLPPAGVNTELIDFFSDVLFYACVIIMVSILGNKIYLVNEAWNREKALDYSKAAEIWDLLGILDEAARVRKLEADMKSTKIEQTVVHGDMVQGDKITKTVISDSVVNKSNIGSEEKE